MSLKIRTVFYTLGLSIFCLSLIFLPHFHSHAQTPPFDLMGWGWFGNPIDDGTGYSTIGFVSLNCANDSLSCADGDYKAYVNTSNKVKGYAWIGISDQAAVAGGKGLGFLKFDPSASAPDGTKTGVEYDPNTGKLSGWGRIMNISRDVGFSSEEGWVKFRDDLHATEQWGVEVDEDDDGNYYLRGLAWSAGDTISLGFINFGLETWEDVTGTPWLKTEEGDIYVNGNMNAAVDADAEYGQQNAAYYILADGSITNYTSEAGVDWVNGNLDLDYSYPDETELYENVMGKIDVDGLIDADPITNLNKYGYVVDTTTIAGYTWSGDQTLYNEIYYVDGDLTIDNNLRFTNGLSGEDGSGLIVVDGDLNIDYDIIYQDATALSEVYNLATVAWIVKGDINIDSSVRTLVGNYFVLGSTGIVNTGSGTYPLEISGLLFARQFNFEREYTGTQPMPDAAAPAENIIYDGRIIANTPPGLGDFAELLPQFQQVIP